MDFESLIDLVNFYMKHPLYKKVKLSHPIPKDMLKRINTMNVGISVDRNNILIVSGTLKNYTLTNLLTVFINHAILVFLGS